VLSIAAAEHPVGRGPRQEAKRYPRMGRASRGPREPWWRCAAGVRPAGGPAGRGGARAGTSMV